MKIGEPYSPFRAYNAVCIPGNLLTFKGLTPGAKLLMGRLLQREASAHPGKDPYVITTKKLADEIGSSERAILGWIHDLKSHGLLDEFGHIHPKPPDWMTDYSIREKGGQ